MRRVQEAKEQLKVCCYKNKMTLSFEKYVTLLKECFDTLDEDERPITKCDKIDYLLDGIQNQALASANIQHKHVAGFTTRLHLHGKHPIKGSAMHFPTCLLQSKKVYSPGRHPR